jgi:GAF domain-containing protein
MTQPTLPTQEAQRLQSLTEHQLLDASPEEVYDNITRLAAEICGTPIAAITLLAGDRHATLSSFGLPVGSTPLEPSYCAHTIVNPEQPMVVADTRYDERFTDNLQTIQSPNIIFYAGVPLKDAEGLALGCLCVMDHRPRELSDAKLLSLKTLGQLVDTHFQLRRTQFKFNNAQARVMLAKPVLRTVMLAIAMSKGSRENEADYLRSLQEVDKSLQSMLDALQDNSI